MIAKRRNISYSRLLMSAFIAVMVVLFVSLAAVPSAFAYDNEELAFLTYINNHRQAYGLAPLTLSTTIYNASEGHSYDMGARNYFSHNTPEGVTPWDRIRAAGYTYNTYLGENIAAGWVTAESVFVAWRDSPEHNANMLSANFRAIGIGRYYVAGSIYGWYWTTDFGGVSDTVVVPVPIDATLVGKWNALNGGPGAAVNMAQTITGGKFQDFINGRLVWNESTNEVYWVHGAILTKYDQLGRETGDLGLPTSDEMDVSSVTGARESDFTHGRIYWGPGVGSYGVSDGAIMDKYLAGGGPAVYGIPTSDEYVAGGGKAQNMQKATLTWDGTGSPAYAVVGGILAKYKAKGGPTGSIGLAVSDEQDVAGVPGARESQFAGGRIFWGPGVGSYALKDDKGFLQMYINNGDAAYLGIPTSDDYPAWDGRGQNFQKAIFTWNPRNNAHYVRGGVMVKYQMTGGPAGYLHLIIDEEKPLSPSLPAHADAVAAIFENGRVYWSGTTGSHIVNGGVYVTYMSVGGPQGRLGLPITDEYDIALPGGGRRSRFEHGFITWGLYYGTWVDYI